MIPNKKIVIYSLIALSSLVLCSKAEASTSSNSSTSSNLNDLFITWNTAKGTDAANAKVNDIVTLGDEFSNKSVAMFNNSVSINGKK